MSNQPLDLSRFQILVVEDEAVTRTAITLLLEHQQAAVVAVGSVTEGMQRLKDGVQPDILLSNIRLPDGTGADVLQCLRRQDSARQRQTPAIAFTGEDLETVQNDPEFVGFQLYLAKPFDARRLVDAIATLVEK